MSFSNSASQKLLRRATNDYEERELVKSESNLKKASTFPTDLPLDMELFGVEKAAYDGNPFLKARVKAYLQDLDKSASNIQLRK